MKYIHTHFCWIYVFMQMFWYINEQISAQYYNKFYTSQKFRAELFVYICPISVRVYVCNFPIASNGWRAYNNYFALAINITHEKTVLGHNWLMPLCASHFCEILQSQGITHHMAVLGHRTIFIQLWLVPPYALYICCIYGEPRHHTWEVRVRS